MPNRINISCLSFYGKYTIDDLYNFVTKILSDKYSVEKIRNNQQDETILSLKITYK